jgi:hypothetical protein
VWRGLAHEPPRGPPLREGPRHGRTCPVSPPLLPRPHLKHATQPHSHTTTAQHTNILSAYPKSPVFYPKHHRDFRRRPSSCLCPSRTLRLSVSLNPPRTAPESSHIAWHACAKAVARLRELVPKSLSRRSQCAVRFHSSPANSASQTPSPRPMRILAKPSSRRTTSTYVSNVSCPFSAAGSLGFRCLLLDTFR